MKKIIIPGAVVTFMLLIIILVGKTHLTLRGFFPGTQPVEIWERNISGRLTVAEESGNIILVEEKDKKINIKGVDYLGKVNWEEEGEDQVDFFFGEKYWSAVQFPRGTIKIYDYQGKQAGIFKIRNGSHKIWIGPEGQVACLGSIISKSDDAMEGLHKEKLEVYNLKGELMMEESFTGKAVLDLIFLPGEDILVINQVEVFPQVSSKIIILNLEGKVLSEISSLELFLGPILLKVKGQAAFVSGQEFYLYNSKENSISRHDFYFKIHDCFLTSKDDILLISSDEGAVKGTTKLVCVNRDGKVLWDKDLPGTYLQGKGRADGEILIETDAFLYLMHPDGSTQAYYSPEEETKIFLLSTNTFLTYKGGTLKACRWEVEGER